jgi:phosphohistidine phosphatase SixA
VLVRHAVTDPGFGDPPGFSLHDCKTQRNLSAEGRKEAQRLGAAFRARGIPVARVLASPWCRCQETARLAFGGARSDSTLANLFGRPEESERQKKAFAKLMTVPIKPGEGNLILVTHGSTTVAFTGVSPAPAEMVVVTPEGGGRFRVAGRIPLAD